MVFFLRSIVLLMIWTSSFAFDNSSRVAFYYAGDPPLEELHAYNVVVVAYPNKLSVKTYNNASSQLYAYVSVGELAHDAAFRDQTDPSWRLGANSAWKSSVMDLANPAWREFLLTKLIGPAYEAGYRGFFLDTLDSYQSLKLSKEAEKAQLDGLVTFIQTIKLRYPQAAVILNRGFEALDAVHQDVQAVAAESLFKGWNASHHQYEPVTAQNREWLLAKLKMVQQHFHLPVIVVDYLPNPGSAEAQETARKIAALGFIPWVADPEFKSLGTGSIQIVPRKILLLYNPEERYGGENKSISVVTVFSFATFPLQFMGFVPILQPIDASLPKGNLKDRVAGIIAWVNKPVLKNHQLFETWLSEQFHQGIPIVFLKNFGLPKNAPLLTALQLNISPQAKQVSQVNVASRDKSIGYEAFPEILSGNFFPISAQNARVLLRLESGGKAEDAIAITPWGGYVLSPYDIISLPNEQSRWVVNPFDFFKEALRLPDLPIPDLTTSSGRRILSIHVDGDGFVSRVPWKQQAYAGEVLLEDIIKPYHLPMTLSIIQREFELMSRYPMVFKYLTKIAQDMFALSWVQVASHTYSHPLQWAKLVEGKPNIAFVSYPDKNHLFNYQQEINGSTDYINQYLAPANKKVSVMFWSGDANLQEKPLALTYQANLKNINGMARIYLNNTKSVTNLSPIGINVGDYFQVFSPIPNDFQYTDNWTRPLYGFQNVIRTFELTESPVRYKPMSVYYHFYSAADQASLRALKRVYDWVSKQESIPLQIGDYISKVMDFNQLVIAKNLNNTNEWLIMNNNGLREFRWPQSRGLPVLSKQSNVIGFVPHNQDYYLHLGPEGSTSIQVAKELPTLPYLVSANAEVVRWDVLDGKHITFALKGYVPLNFKLANMNHCQVLHKNQPILVSSQGYSIKGVSSGQFEIQCTE